MAFADPQSVNSSNLNRTYTGTQVGSFVAADAAAELAIDPRGTSRRRRQQARYYVKYPVTVDGITVEEKAMVSFTIDRPKAGLTDAQIEAQADAFIAWLNASSKAALKKLIVGEN